MYSMTASQNLAKIKFLEDYIQTFYTDIWLFSIISILNFALLFLRLNIIYTWWNNTINYLKLAEKNGKGEEEKKDFAQVNGKN